MASQPTSDSAPSPEFREAFLAEAGERRTLAFDRFVALALYHPSVGYYRRNRPRVGYGGETDFFTSSSTGRTFGELVGAACDQLLGADEARRHHFVEIGAEPGAALLSEVAHPFASASTVRSGEPMTLTGHCVVFSNELFDAQPFRRFRFRQGSWRELGTRLDEDALREVEVEAASLPAMLPATAPEGYVVDLPLSATTLLQKISSEPWTGLFVAFDYGKTWRELAEACPAGTARAYYRHRQGNDLLARPGAQDLTCHVCWDWLADALKGAGFDSPTLESQESFLIRHAAPLLESAVREESNRLSARKLALLQLLQRQGQKFQVLWALRKSRSL